MKSLFYLAVVGASFDLYEAAHKVIDAKRNEEQDEDDTDDEFPFVLKEIDPPMLTIFAIEEPENHLAPHYLGRIMHLLRRMADASHGQVLLTSHSASIMSRVEPEDVRYLRLREDLNTTLVTKIVLPEESDEAFKFVREAVRAHPELYFARLVVLGEGDSEEIVLPKVAEALDVSIDRSFVSIVPLGGRHVNHFWRLLATLEIPYVTLLDLDLERSGGGWGRIKYVCNQLMAVGKPANEIHNLVAADPLDDAKLDTLHKRPPNPEQLKPWLKALEAYGVFFSAPLDLDFMMLRKFPKQYEETADAGPNIPGDTAKYEAALERVLTAVLKENHGSGESYNAEQKKAFFWYRYLFLTRAKPTSHLLALSAISSKDLATNAPEVLRRLIARMKTALRMSAEGEGDAG
jgi:hypothetical protein